MTTTDTPHDTTPPDPLDGLLDSLAAAALPAGSVAGTDVTGLLHAAEMMLDRYAEQYDTDGLPKECRRARQLSTIVDHVRRVEQSDSTGYIVEKSTRILDAAVVLEFEARADMTERSGNAQLIDEAGEQLEALIRRLRPVVSGLAGGELRRDDVRSLTERFDAMTRWGRQLEPIAVTGSDD